MVRGARMPTEEDGMQPLIRAEMTCSPHEKLGSVVFQQEAVKTTLIFLFHVLLLTFPSVHLHHRWLGSSSAADYFLL